jgi:hypothetical protein
LAFIPGAEVTATLIKTGALRTTTTNTEVISNSSSWSQALTNVRASFNGFAPQTITISSIAGQNIVLDFTLIPADIKVDTVVVTASEAPLVDTKRTVVGTTLNTKETQLLPIPTRSALDLVFTLSAVTEEPLSTRDLAEDRNTVTNATPKRQEPFHSLVRHLTPYNLTIDGLDNNDDRAARERFQPPLETVEEVQVITNQFSAEYGRASGGRVNLRTRSGSSEFRGRGFYFFRDEALNANSFKNNSLGLSRLPLQEHVGGFTFSARQNYHAGISTQCSLLLTKRQESWTAF